MNMAKFHINKHGVPAPCKAKDGNCPFGGGEKHFDNLEDAQNYATEQNENEFGILCGINILSGERLEDLRNRRFYERYNQGSGEFNQKEFSSEVNKFMSESVLDEVRDNDYKNVLVKTMSKNGEYILSHYVEDELKEVMKNKEPNYFSKKDYNKVLSSSIEKGVERYITDFAKPHVKQKYKRYKGKAQEILKANYGDKVNNEDIEIKMNTHINNLSSRLDLINEAIENEPPGYSQDVLSNQRSEIAQELYSARDLLDNLNDSQDDIERMNKYSKDWGKQVSQMAIEKSGENGNLDKFREYSRKTTLESNLFYKTIAKKFNWK